MTDITCATCKYLDGPTEQCRHFGPVGATIAQERLQDKKPWLACWPIVQKTDWCGDHAPKHVPVDADNLPF